MTVSETELLLKGYGLTTAEFFYRMPDYQHVLNSFVWQEYDLAPDHPRLFEFVDFWQREVEGPLHSVVSRIAKCCLAANGKTSSENLPCTDPQSRQPERHQRKRQDAVPAGHAEACKAPCDLIALDKGARS